MKEESVIEKKNTDIDDNSYKNLNNSNKVKLIILKAILILLSAGLLTCISFAYTTYPIDVNIMQTYSTPLLFALNFLPILLLILLFTVVSKRVHTSFLITSILIMIMGIINQTKILYRDDIFKFEDLLLAKEALTIANTQGYGIVIGWHTIFSILIILVVYFLLKKYINKLELSYTKQLMAIIVCLGLMYASYIYLFTNKNVYNSVGDISKINVWIETRQYQIRGLIYPFIYTLDDGFIQEPKNYNEDKSKKVLAKYEYTNIPKDKKVNIISIMLEAYNDFSKFNVFDFKEDVYEDFHNIQKNSISGNLVTTVFGGGTVQTERSFLTGYDVHPSFRQRTNSYVWYLKEQGYKTEAMHPIYGAFYNRTSYNPNLGFDMYYNYENKYSALQKAFLRDGQFFNYIIEGYENAKKENTPYFNFSVTYQNHGPYRSGNYEDKEFFIENNGYDEESYNIINEYFAGIKSTNLALKNLIEFFDNEEEPVIIILFGDHNPSLGDLGYSEFGINIDLSTIDGFENYYGTPYIIHGNNAAKKVFNKSFVGQGDTISPIFLMNELFDYCGLDGNEFSQYMSNLKQRVDVISSYYYKENGEYISKEDSRYKKLVEEYYWVSYYHSHNYKLNVLGGKND